MSHIAILLVFTMELLQMRALRGRQAALLALQQDAETRLAEARHKSNEGNESMHTCIGFASYYIQ